MKTQITTIGILLLALCAGISAHAQSLNVNWVNGTHGTNAIQAEHIETDNTGNIYVAGRFQGTVDIDPSAITNNVTSNGANDIFLQKFDPQGSLLWAKQFGGNAQDYVYDMAVTGSGDVYLTGQFAGTIDLNPNSGTQNYTSNGGSDAFLVKLNSDGSFNWSRRVGGTGNDVGQVIDLVLGGTQLNWVGNFSNTVDMDPMFGIDNHTSQGSTDVFLTKLQATGGFVHAVSFGGTGLVRVVDLVSDYSTGDIFITGYFSGTANFNPAGGGTSTATGNRGLYVVHLSTTGNYKKRFIQNCSQNVIPTAIALDDSTGVYISGYFDRSLTFDGNTYTPSMSNNDGMLIKLNRIGNLTFGREAFAHWRSASNFRVRDVEIVDGGNVFVCGSFLNTANFDFTPANTQTISNGKGDFFVQELTRELNYTTAPYFGGGSETDIAYDVAINDDGEIFTCGSFEDNVNFHSSISLQSDGLTDAFVVKFGLAPLAVNNVIDKYPNWSLYPNPSQGLLNIKSVEPIKNITIYSITGQVLKNQATDETQATIDISDLPSANYFISINGQMAQTFTKK